MASSSVLNLPTARTGPKILQYKSLFIISVAAESPTCATYLILNLSRVPKRNQVIFVSNCEDVKHSLTHDFHVLIYIGKNFFKWVSTSHRLRCKRPHLWDRQNNPCQNAFLRRPEPLRLPVCRTQYSSIPYRTGASRSIKNFCKTIVDREENSKRSPAIGPLVTVSSNPSPTGVDLTFSIRISMNLSYTLSCT